MEYITLKGSKQKVSRISLGTMNIVSRHVDENGNKSYSGKSVEEVEELIKGALDLGINLIDTADIYGHGLSEKLIGEVIKRNPGIREKMLIQTKCGVVSTEEERNYNFDGDYIIQCVNASLERLRTDYIDIFLLHKPDPLYDPGDIGQAFERLYEEGKVLNFGVCNLTSMQTALIQKHCKRPIAVSQVQLSMVHTLLIDSTLNCNTNSEFGIDRDSGLMDYCRLKDIRMEAYSIAVPVPHKGTFIDNPEYAELNAVMDRLCEKYHTNKNALTVAWILRHPAGIIPTIGTTKLSRVKDSLDALNYTLTRQEWYDLYLAANHPLW
ncbi:MAG: aldo/keto reductase family oxidoreductase [Hespellia sp.]|nr:aldo/keto reductase family oxidoreductase [Hespellia sp.]